MNGKVIKSHSVAVHSLAKSDVRPTFARPVSKIALSAAMLPGKLARCSK